MKNFQLIAERVNVMPLMHAVQRAPHLWNQNKWRTSYEGTPHADVSDIWLRYSGHEATKDLSNTAPVLQDVRPIWYPAWEKLPEARPLVFDLMRAVGAYELGRLLITKIPPGGQIMPHCDADGAYTDTADGHRYHVVLQGLPGSLFGCEDETVNMRTGEVWFFNHRGKHWVKNNSADDRIHLLVDLRVA